MSYPGVRYEADGWPVNVDGLTRQWMVERVQKLASMGSMVTLEQARCAIFAADDRPESLRNWCLFDYQYAAVERALRAAGLQQVWVREVKP